MTKILEAYKTSDQYVLRVHLDTSRTITDERGQTVPDPEYVVEYRWGTDIPDDLTGPDYLERLLVEVRALVRSELDRRSGGRMPLSSVEGVDL